MYQIGTGVGRSWSISDRLVTRVGIDISYSLTLILPSNNSGLGGQNENRFLKFGCLISNTHVEMYFFFLLYHSLFRNETNTFVAFLPCSFSIH